MLIVVAHMQSLDRASASPQASTSPQTSTSTRRSTRTETPFPAETRGSWQARGSGPSTQAASFCAEQTTEQGRPGQAGPGQQRHSGAPLNRLGGECRLWVMLMASKAWKIAFHFFLYPISYRRHKSGLGWRSVGTGELQERGVYTRATVDFRYHRAFR